MNMQDLDIAELMSDVSQAGLTVMLKIDHERMAHGGRPWTILLSGPAIGKSSVIRWDCRSLEESVRSILDKLREVTTWEWLDLYPI